MRLIKPPPLRPGDRVAVVAPGGPVDRRMLRRGLAWLDANGYQVTRGEHLSSRRGFLAGSDADRLRDLNRAIADERVRGVWFARGGYGCHRIVSGADFAPLAKSPKALIGYSDITVLQSAAWKALRLASYQGPMVSELGSPRTFDEPALRRALSGGPLRFPVSRRQVLRPGSGAGPVVGGCLSILVSLLGTPFDLDTTGTVLFWEEVNEEPFRIDRMLAQLRLAGRLESLRGMVVGRLVGCRASRPGNSLPLREMLSDHLAGTSYPVVIGFPAGHGPRKVTLPFGRPARLDTRSLSLAFD